MMNLQSMVAKSLSCAALLACFFAVDAAACSCAFGGGAPCQDFWKADAVFIGTSAGGAGVKIKRGNYEVQQNLIRFDVAQVYRGDPAAQLEVVTGQGDSDCGYGFRLGQTYLVYAHKGEDGKLYTGICTRTRSLAEADDDLAYFRALAAAKRDVGFISGKIERRNHQHKEGDAWRLPVADAELVIEGAGARVERRTDARGAYRVEGLAPGKYTVTLKIPKGLTDGMEKDSATRVSEVEVAARGCAVTGFWLESDTRIGGRVLDAAGQPVVGMRLQARAAPSNKSGNANLEYATTDADGYFEFKTVEPGDYIFGFRLISVSRGDEKMPYHRTYFPGVPTVEQARAVTVREGERLRDLELRLPPALVEREVIGKVVWRDGRPAANVSISLSLFDVGDYALANYDLRTDENGRFALKLFEGLRYRVNAFTEDASRAYASSEPVEIIPTADAAPLKLVLPPPRKPEPR